MIRQTFDMDAINSILHHPDIWKDIAPDGCEPFDTPYCPDILYYLVNDGDGVITVHPFRDSCKVHPNFPMNRRGKVAYDAVEEVCQKLFDLGYPSIYAEIDRKLRHVTLFARQLGFRLLESGNRDLFIRRNLDS